MAPFSIHGIGVSNGIAIGRAHLISNALLEVVQYDIEIKNIHRLIKNNKNEIKAFHNVCSHRCLKLVNEKKYKKIQKYK